MNSIQNSRVGVRLFGYVSSFLLLCFLVSCGKENEQDSITVQQTNIATYLDTLRGRGYTDITTIDDVYRAVFASVAGAETVSEGDSVIFYYKAGIFSQLMVDGFYRVFDTNIDTVALNRKLDIGNPMVPYRAIAGKNQFIYGLEKGLLQMSEGERAQLIFTSNHGYGKHAMGTIPINSPLIFEVTMVEVKKN